MASTSHPTPHPIVHGQRRRWSMEKPPSMSRIVLVGKTGSGKSSCANTILGREAFKAAVSGSSVTRECSKQTGEVLDRQVTIVDTPGLFDTSLPEETVRREIAKCVNMSAPGPHAIIVVVKVGPFLGEQRNAVKEVEEIFGKDAARYCMILFTHGDRVTSGIDKLISEADKELQETLSTFGNRYHIFNNMKINDRSQVLELFEKVDKMVAVNEGDFYSNYTYLEVVKMLDDREAELKRCYQEKLAEEIKALKSKYDDAMTTLMAENLTLTLNESNKRREGLEKRKRFELKEMERFYHGLETNARHIVEQVPRSDAFDKIIRRYPETLLLN